MRVFEPANWSIYSDTPREEWQYGERRYLSETSMRDLTDQLTHPNHPDPTHLLTA